MLRRIAPQIIKSRSPIRAATGNFARPTLACRKSRRHFTTALETPSEEPPAQQKVNQSGLDTINTLDIFDGESFKMNINAYSDAYFVVGEERVKGSILVFPEGYFSLHVSTIDDITVEALSVVEIKRPVPRFLLFGTGKTLKPLQPSLVDYLRENRLSYEVLDTPNAVATYNFMNQEGRDVAAFIVAIDANSSLAPKEDTASFPPMPEPRRS